VIIAGSRECPQGARYHRSQGGFSGYRTDFILKKNGCWPAPQAMLIEQDPGTTVRTHYHDRHQFQIFLNPAGSIGRRETGTFALHYTTPESAYGPLVARDTALSYLTLRAVSTDTGAFFIPESREQMRAGLPKRQLHTMPPTLSDITARKLRASVETEILITPDDTGVAAWILRLPPGVHLDAPYHAPSGGRFYVVASGSLMHDHEELMEQATLWASPEDEPVNLTAGTNGLELVVVQFPEAARQDRV